MSSKKNTDSLKRRKNRGRGRGQWGNQAELLVTPGGSPSQLSPEMVPYKEQGFGGPSIQTPRYSAQRHLPDFSSNFSRSDQLVSTKHSPMGMGPTAGGTPPEMTVQKSLEEIKGNVEPRSQVNVSDPNISRSNQSVSTTHSPVMGFVVGPSVSDKINPDATSQKALKEIKQNVEEQTYADAKDVILPPNSKAASVTSSASEIFGDVCSQISTVVKYGVNDEQDLFVDCKNSEDTFETTGVADSGRSQMSEPVESSRNMKMITKVDVIRELEEKISTIQINPFATGEIGDNNTTGYPHSHIIKSITPTQGNHQSATYKQYYTAMTNVIGEISRSDENDQTNMDDKLEYNNTQLYTDKTVKYTKGEDFKDFKGKQFKECKGSYNKDILNNYKRDISDSNAANETKGNIFNAIKEDAIKDIKEEAVNKMKQDNTKEVPRATVVDTREGTKGVMQTNASSIKDTTKETKKDVVKDIRADAIKGETNSSNIKGESVNTTEECLERDYKKDSVGDKVQLPLAIKQSGIWKSKDIEDKQEPYEKLMQGIQAKVEREYFEIASGGEDLAMPVDYGPKSSAKSLVLKVIHMLSMEHSQTNVEAIFTLTDLLKIIKND